MGFDCVPKHQELKVCSRDDKHVWMELGFLRLKEVEYSKGFQRVSRALKTKRGSPYLALYIQEVGVTYIVGSHMSVKYGGVVC